MVVGFSPFSALSTSCCSLLACRDSVERSADSFMEIPLYAIFCFSLADFNIFSLYLIFVSLNNMYVGVVLLRFFFTRDSGLPGLGLLFPFPC